MTSTAQNVACAKINVQHSKVSLCNYNTGNYSTAAAKDAVQSYTRRTDFQLPVKSSQIAELRCVSQIWFVHSCHHHRTDSAWYTDVSRRDPWPSWTTMVAHVQWRHCRSTDRKNDRILCPATSLVLRNAPSKCCQFLKYAYVCTDNKQTDTARTSCILLQILIASGKATDD